MKVLYITNVPAPYTVDFFSQLGQRIDLTVIYERKTASDRNCNWNSNAFVSYKEFYLKGINFGHEQRVSLEIIKYLKDSYDVVVVGNYSSPTGMLAIIYLRLKNKKYILHADGGIIKQDSRVKYNLKKWLVSGANNWFSSGKYCTKYLTHYGADYNKCYEYCLASIHDNDIAHEPSSEKEKNDLRTELGLGLSKEDFIFLAVGSNIHRKGYDILDEALEIVKQKCDRSISVIAIGDGYKNEYHNITFVPFKEFEVIKRYMRCSDAFIHPTREDIWGLVIAEAMSQGLIVITTDNCMAGLELVNRETGIVVPVQNSEALALAMISIMNLSKIQFDEMQKRCIQIASNYTIEKMVERYYKILCEVIEI
ncbi:Glycosyltransferase involved in cell wall bisynthesis [Butyrivibrio fibrisolvens DSM 3071]|uniref:Glycosyltransferase involved in cell wall bisynthesis n=1 Tax=Butyrivibrio fibrisolvens DSM 3071 TaxID=1121131 RepID=A0A1M6ERY7_BUTFI|nr:glycosyltransferase family 4 protein [Butyrivibrio fibrisolvens]SHI88208.1 Glycosyltransferase involved in cell wall bisynthesis [Butyrivibrio fibrisolvens DSM 3071]